MTAAVETTASTSMGPKGLLKCEDDDGPISIDEIEPGLFLGNLTAATNLAVLKQKDIKFILTLDTVPLPEHIIQKPSLTTKFIKISDMSKEDMLHRFGECIEFIVEALENSKNILVHCYFGVSRSAAIVIAYIMQKYKIGYDLAFERVKSKRRFVGPNPGFVLQLKLFKKMNFKIEPQNPYYKSYRLRLAGSQVRKAKILPQTCMDVIQSDPGLTQENPEPIVYRCRKCRRIVASKSNLILHSQQNRDKNDTKIYESNDNNKGKENLVEEIAANVKEIHDNNQRHCNRMLFVEPMAWMKNILTHTNGRLDCPKCGQKLGHFNWVSSAICPCGSQVCPAFYIVPSKVELSKIVQNVQMTV